MKCRYSILAIIGLMMAPLMSFAADEDQQTNSVEAIRQLNAKVDEVIQAQKKVLPSEFNPSIGLVGEGVFSYRSKGSDETGSDRPGGVDAWLRSVELNLAAAADPFAKAYAVINASSDQSTGEATPAVEEAALQTTCLPGNLTLLMGRFFGEFGRLGNIHDHELPFVNRPLALDEYMGGETKTDGLQLNWLLPLERYVSLTAGLGDQFGDDPNNPGVSRSFSELNLWGRLSSYFELSPDWQFETGASGLINPKTEDRAGVLVQPDDSTLTERERRLAGVDFTLRYVPLRDNQFRSFTWGTELLYSDNKYLSDPDGSLNPDSVAPDLSGDESTGSVGSYGLYSYVTYKMSRVWSVGYLQDWLENAQNNKDQTTAYSPFVTCALSHFDSLRLQFTHTNHDPVSGLQDDDAVYLQWAWIIGAHSHGWQQR